uniref:Uncharacterized protein n=1 Tax=Romanomermis culicivorax TaxID=13658 RepID=A0A915L9D0_ROMCU
MGASVASIRCRSIVPRRIVAVAFVSSVSILMVAMWIARVVMAIKMDITGVAVLTVIVGIAAARRRGIRGIAVGRRRGIRLRLKRRERVHASRRQLSGD